MTMAVVLRDLGVPARIVVGFLPGERSAGLGLEVIRNTEAHAWVEVYFPGCGWVAFDPTAGALPQRLPAAAAAESGRADRHAHALTHLADASRPHVSRGTPPGRAR